MSKKIKCIFLLLGLIFSINLKAQIPAAIIPEFNFFKLDQKPFAKKDLASGKLLFFVFFDPTCEHCQHSVQYMNAHYSSYKKPAIYMISMSPEVQINQFMNKYGSALKTKPNITLLQDKKNEFILKFKPKKYPGLFLYSAQKKLILYSDDDDGIQKMAKAIKEAK